RLISPVLHNSSFIFTHTPNTDTYTLSLHDALPIYAAHRQDARLRESDGRASAAPRRGRPPAARRQGGVPDVFRRGRPGDPHTGPDRKSTRLNSSHGSISYAVFWLKK